MDPSSVPPCSIFPNSLWLVSPLPHQPKSCWCPSPCVLGSVFFPVGALSGCCPFGSITWGFSLVPASIFSLLTGSDEDEEQGKMGSMMCLIEKVLTNKPFNAFGLLEMMKRAMNPPRGFTTKKIGNKLFSSSSDPCPICSEFDGGEQPSTVTFTMATFWVCLYDFPMTARSPKSITQIGENIGKVIEVDLTSLDGLARSIRVKIEVDFCKPLRRGIHLQLRDKK
ncbi:hypothetical protein ACS0TY_013309 [Phlomoides rotata]